MTADMGKTEVLNFFFHFSLEITLVVSLRMFNLRAETGVKKASPSHHRTKPGSNNLM